MQKTKAKIITALLLTALTLPLVPLAFASTGNILINQTALPQTLPITPVPAGGNVSLNFNAVTFSGSQFYLLLSQDGLSQVSSGDLRYTPLFNVANVMDAVAIFQVTDINYPGAWTIGQGWVNGTTPLNIPGGTFYIKAFDGATTALAVTQGIPIIASLRIIPDAGSAGTTIIISGNAFPANSLVNLTYLNPITGPPFITINNLTATNALGQFNYTMTAPDLKQAPLAGDTGLPVPTNVIPFQATLNATTPVVYNANYTEAQRGLLQFGRPRGGPSVPGSLQNATGVFGNLTSFVGTVSVGVGDTLRIVGNSFYPGTVSMTWDNTIDLSSTLAGNTANQTGYFNATFKVPGTGLGAHNITLLDNGLQKFIVFVNVVQSITISPTSGPIGTTVTVNGFGFPSNGVPAGNVYNVTVTVGALATVRASALTDSSGQFTASFNIPSGTAGGANIITATANDSLLTFATATFTVTANFIVSPTSFYANSSNTAVAASGTGLTPSTAYFVAIDNLFSPFTNTTNGVMSSTSGVLNFTFIGVGFQPGLHVVAIYASGSGSGFNTPTANATFTVLADPVTSQAGILSAINNTVTQTNTTVNTIKDDVDTITDNLAAINATIVAINGNIATLSTSVGIIRTNVTTIAASITSISSGFATVNTNVGTLTTTIQSLSGTLSSISGTVGTISSSVGSLSTDLSAINTKVTSIQNGVATIQTDLGTLQGTVTSTDGKVATIQTSIGTLQADVSKVQTSVDNVPGQVNIPIWIAVVLALVAALAAIASLLLVRRKIAG